MGNTSRKRKGWKERMGGIEKWWEGQRERWKKERKGYERREGEMER